LILYKHFENSRPIASLLKTHFEELIYRVILQKFVLATKTVIRDYETIIMAGAYSKSVQDGSGIQNNAGYITLLNIACSLDNFQLQAAIRSTRWSPEEEGFLESDFYTVNVTERHQQNQNVLKLRYYSPTQLYLWNLRR
jgi:hypothetical protein